MSTAIFLTPHGTLGYRIEICEDHTALPQGWAHLIVEDKNGNQKFVPLFKDDWVQLRDRIDQLLNNR